MLLHSRDHLVWAMMYQSPLINIVLTNFLTLASYIIKMEEMSYKNLGFHNLKISNFYIMCSPETYKPFYWLDYHYFCMCMFVYVPMIYIYNFLKHFREALESSSSYFSYVKPFD